MEVISELLGMNSHWLGEKYNAKPRNINLRVYDGKISVILGPRRTGKTFLLKIYINELIEKGIQTDRIFYVDFFHPFMVEYKDALKFLDLVKTYIRYRGLSYDNLYILIDEIQELNNWEKVAEYLRVKGSRVIITGSNASLLSEDVGYRLVGRYNKIEVFTLSFKEYLMWKEVKNDFIFSEILKDYSFSAFPEYVIYNNKDYLSQIFYDIIHRDIFWRHDIKEKSKFMDLIVYLLDNVGRYITNKSISRACSISEKSVKEFLFYLENSYLFFFLSRYSLKTLEIIKSPRKVYIIDNSFAILKRRKFLEDKGRYMENLVFLELKRRNKEVYYYQTKEGYEVDFLIKDLHGIKELIQVCYEVSNEETLKREIRALLHAKDDLGLGDDVPLTVITWEYEDTREVEWWNKRGKIRFIPLWKWLLEI